MYQASRLCEEVVRTCMCVTEGTRVAGVAAVGVGQGKTGLSESGILGHKRQEIMYLT